MSHPNGEQSKKPLQNPVPLQANRDHAHQSPLTSTVLTREDLLPPSVAKEHGLDENTYSTIEAPCQGSLYDALLLYAAQYAVDLDEDLSKFPAHSTPTNATTKQQKPVDSNDVKSTNKNSSVSNPSSTSHELSNAAHIAPEVRQYLEAGPRKTLITKRDGPGRLSSLWNCPEDDLESFDSSSSSGSDSDSDAENTYGLRQRRPPRVQRWQLGLGYAKLLLFDDEEDGEEGAKENSEDASNHDAGIDKPSKTVGSELIILRHVALSPPLASYDDFSMYRTLVCAAQEPRTLQRLCALVTKWKEDRADSGNRSRPGTFTLYRYKLYGSSGAWERQRRKRGRPKNSVILKDRMLEAIVNDVKDFCAKDTKAWYEEHGIPHRRSLLFYGPPGTGKTSTIKMLAGMFRLNACFLSFTSPDFSNQSLHDALSSLPGRALLVLEDVDVLFNEDRKAETSSSVTFSGLLNAIDGLISVDGIITIFTTNHIERLDRALIRGGRVDRRFEFVHPNARHIANVFQSFYPDAEDQLAKEFAQAILDRKEEEARTIATMQQHFIFTRRLSARECIDKVPVFFEEYYAEGGKTRNLFYA